MIPPLLAVGLYPIAIAFFFLRFERAQAICLSVLIAYLFLPEDRGFELSILPVLDKDRLPIILVTLICMVGVNTPAAASDQTILPGWFPRSKSALFFIGLVFIGTIGTAMTNLNPLVFSIRTVPGMQVYDIGSNVILSLVLLLPLFVARRFLGHPDTHATLLRILVVLGLIYSLLALYEARMSPQLNIKIYGYFQHFWNQHLRGNGYRPIVFLQHGLWVSLFFSMTVLSAFALYRNKTEQPQSRLIYLAAAGWLLLTLVISKSLGALVIALLLAPIILFMNTRVQLICAVLVAAIATTYPFLRGADLVPIDQITNAAESIDHNRALSLGTRLKNEDLLLAKAQQKPLFGWGSWGRNRVYNDAGFSITIPDGYWIIVIGASGWVGYIGIFGLLSTGIVGLARRTKSFGVTPATAGLGVVLAGNIVDLIPNAGLTPITWLIAGALLGRIEHGAIKDPDTEDAPEPDPVARYSRFPHKPTKFRQNRTQLSHATR